MSDSGNETLDEGDRLPWLEAVEEDDEQTGPSAVKLIAAVVIGLLAIGLVVGGLFWLGNRGGDESAEAELIEAPEGAYKVAPENAGGMQVEGQGGTAQAASQGAEPRGNLNMSVPETPVTNGAQPQPAPPQPTPPAQSAGPGATIQLGAFSTQAGANSAWAALARRFTYLAPLTHSVVPAQVGGRTLYRLRASGANAADICRRLEVAQESCTVVR
ncbi:SPOR domain-containing protein [Allosphingosinicella sp.]|jgi:hypothetical protein|uniref:SPOR domain-containing protein n=1 Tax=Allosphingosinicella sp. TaxID=2823234 RepID=UPI002EF5B31E